MSESPLVSIRGLEKSFRQRVGSVRVLRGVDLTLRAGERAALVGPSGCGKTTLLNLIAGLERPDAGQLVWDGQDLISAWPDRDRSRWRLESVGFVFQFFYLIEELTVWENVSVPARLAGRWPRLAERAQTLLEAIGLTHCRDRRPSRLSGGERQRAAIARACLLSPRLLLCDEPTGNLDEESGTRVLDGLAQLQSQTGAAILVATHNPAVARWAGTVYRLEHGVVNPVDSQELLSAKRESFS